MLTFYISLACFSICAFVFIGIAMYKEEKQHQFKLAHPELFYDEGEIY